MPHEGVGGLTWFISISKISLDPLGLLHKRGSEKLDSDKLVQNESNERTKEHYLIAND